MKSTPLLLVVALAFLAGCRRAGDDPALADPAQVVAERYAEAFRKRNWGTLYDLGSPSEKQEAAMSRQQFVAIAEAVSQGVDDLFTGANLLPLSSQRRDGYRYYMLTNGKQTRADDVKGTMPGHVFTVRAEGGGWHPYIVPLLGAINLYTPGEPRGRWMKLAKAMRDSGVDRLLLVEARTEIRESRLQRAADGKIVGAAIAVRVGQD